jgi:CubicO group peptidase (beta-lactamase class C family)
VFIKKCKKLAKYYINIIIIIQYFCDSQTEELRCLTRGWESRFISLKLLFTLILVLLGLPCLAQTGIPIPALAHCDASMQQFMQRWQVLGASVALAKDGKLVYERAFGYADVDRTITLQPYHLLRVASLSKSVTALAIMKLVQDGQLSLSHSVFGPEGYLRTPTYTREIHDPRLYHVTVQQLLEHTAGWDRQISCDGYSSSDPIEFPTHVSAVMGVTNPVGDSTLIRFMLRRGLDFEPGARFAYSNVGYLVLGKVLEAVTHQQYETWVRQHVLQPSGVREAHLGHNLPGTRLERESDYQSRYQMPSCYDPTQQVPAAYGGYQVEAMNAHGGWLFSARDLVRLLLTLDGVGARHALLSAATLHTMMQPSAVNAGYAKGWMVTGNNWWHTGNLDGTASEMVHTANGYTWAILLNTSNNSPQFWMELDALGWQWMAGARSWPAHDLFAPAQAANQLQVEAYAAGRFQLTWAAGTGTHRLVLLKADSPPNAFPLDGTMYSVASVLADGTSVVAVEGGTKALLPALDSHRTYYVQVVEFRQDTTTGNHPVYTLEDSPVVVVGPNSGAQPGRPLVRYPSPAHEALALTGALTSGPYHVTIHLGNLVRSGMLAPARTTPVQQLLPDHYLVQMPEAAITSVVHFVNK